MTPSQAFDPAEFKRNIRTEWRSAAAGWRRWLEVVEAEDGGKRHSARLVEIAELQPGVSVLDVGGGYGEPSLTAAHVVGPQGRVVCTDISPEMLAVARERAAEAGLANVEFVSRDAEELEFEEESFDAVLSRATLMFLPDVAGTLKRLRGFMKPGGRLAASVWGPQPLVQFLCRVPRRRRRTRFAIATHRPTWSVRPQRSREGCRAHGAGRLPGHRDRHRLSHIRDRLAGAVHRVHP